MNVAPLVGKTAQAATTAASNAITPEQVRVLDQLVAHLPRPKQLAIAHQLLGDRQVSSSPIVRGPLATVRNALTGVTSGDVRVSQTLSSILSKADQEIANLDGAGVLAQGEYHADYRNVGAIRSMLDTLSALGAF